MYINKWRLDVYLTWDVRQSARGASEEVKVVFLYNYHSHNL